jgi:hypothetical protein
MEWKENDIKLKSYTLDRDGIAIEISGPWLVEEMETFELNITKDISVQYGIGTTETATTRIHRGTFTPMRKHATIKATYNETFTDLEDAKAKAEELLPLFESIG